MNSVSRRLILICILIAAYVLAYNGDQDGNLDYFHEGERLGQMDKLAAGGLPFRDIYVQHGLGEDVIKPWLACRTWGTSVASFRRMGQNSYIYRGYLPPLGLVSGLLAIYCLTRRVALTAAAALVLLICWFEITERQALGLLAIACAANFLWGRRRAWLAAAGFLSALASLYSLEVGIYAGTAIIAWRILEHTLTPGFSGKSLIGDLSAIAVGLLLAIVPFFGWCLSHGILVDFLHNAYAQLFLRLSIFPASYPALSPDSSLAMGMGRLSVAKIMICFYLIALASLGVLILAARQLRRQPSASLSALLLSAMLFLCFYVTLFGRPDMWHMGFVVGPFVVFAAALAGAIRDLSGRPVSGLLIATPALLCLMVLVAVGQGGVVGRIAGVRSSFVPGALQPGEKDLVESHLPRLAGIRLSRSHARFTESLVEYIQAHSRPDETILDLSDFPLFYFLAERQCPSRFHCACYVGQSPLRGEMAEEVMGQKPMPALVIRREEPLRVDDVLDQLVARYYVQDASIGTLELWLRK